VEGKPSFRNTNTRDMASKSPHGWIQIGVPEWKAIMARWPRTKKIKGFVFAFGIGVCGGDLKELITETSH
jgi:hypothetical protein